MAWGGIAPKQKLYQHITYSTVRYCEKWGVPVHINDNAFDDDPNAPFGGFKDSGYGKENGRYSIEDMTELKWVTVQLGERPLPF